MGTLRVVGREGEPVRISGDLYVTGEVLPLNAEDSDEDNTLIVDTADPSNGVPVFPLNAYDSHLRVIRAESCGDDGDLSLWCERYKYFGVASAATHIGSFVIRLRRQAAVAEYPDPSEHWVGVVQDVAGQLTGIISLGWVSPYVRKATLEIDFEDGAAIALNNGQGLDWRIVFREVLWDLEVVESSEVPLPDSGKWTGDSLHKTMLTFRDQDDLDGMWRYHLLCVKQLEFGDGTGAAMYDRANFDANEIPREGFAVASEFVFPDRHEYGRAGGRAIGDIPEAHFRTAVHELGHALGLSHGNGPHFMNTTNSIALLGSGGVPFPDNIVFAFSPIDTVRLQHAPDVLIRPGGPFRGGAFSYSLDPPPPVAIRVDS